MKRWLIALLCPTLMAGCLSGCSSPPVTDGATLVTFGDSITALSTWPKDTAAALNMHLVNAGVGGHTSAHGLERFERDVTPAAPDFVIISFGSNDFYRPDGGNPRVSLEEYEANLNTLISKTQALDAIPILMTPPFISPTAFGDASPYPGGDINEALDLYVDTMRAVAEKRKIGLIDIHALCDDGQTVDTFLCGDGVHLSALGNRLYTQTIRQFMTGRFSRDMTAPKVTAPTAPPLQSGDWTQSAVSFDADAWRPVFPNTIATTADNDSITFTAIEGGWPEVHYSPPITEAVTLKVARSALTLDLELEAATNISLFFNGITPTLTYTDEWVSLSEAILKTDPAVRTSGSDILGGQRVRCTIPFKEFVPLDFIANDGTVVLSGVKIFVVGQACESVTIHNFCITAES